MYKFCNNWSFSSAGQDMFSSYASSGTSAIRYGTSGTMSGLSQPTMSNTRRTSPIHPGSWSSGYRPSQVIYLLVFIMWHSDVWIDWLKCHHLSPLLISLSNFFQSASDYPGSSAPTTSYSQMSPSASGSPGMYNDKGKTNLLRSPRYELFKYNIWLHHCICLNVDMLYYFFGQISHFLSNLTESVFRFF